MSARVELHEEMLTSAIRYALGRATYIVGMTVDEAIKAWPGLSDKVRGVIVRDIDWARGTHGFDADAKDWERLMQFAEDYYIATHPAEDPA